MIIKPYSRKTHYYETDQMGIIHYANYIHWMEEARVDFMDQIGFNDSNKKRPVSLKKSLPELYDLLTSLCESEQV